MSIQLTLNEGAPKTFLQKNVPNHYPQLLNLSGIFKKVQTPSPLIQEISVIWTPLPLLQMADIHYRERLKLDRSIKVVLELLDLGALGLYLEIL